MLNTGRSNCNYICTNDNHSSSNYNHSCSNNYHSCTKNNHSYNCSNNNQRFSSNYRRSSKICHNPYNTYHSCSNTSHICLLNSYNCFKNNNHCSNSNNNCSNNCKSCSNYRKNHSKFYSLFSNQYSCSTRNHRSSNNSYSQCNDNNSNNFLNNFDQSAVSSTRLENTEAEVGVEFDKTTPVKELPENSVVAETVKEGAVNSTVNFNVTIVSDSIAIIKTPKTNSTTASPEVPTNATTTTPSTAATTTTTTTAESTVVRRVTFRSLGETFTTDLLDASSTAFKNRAALIESTLKPYFERDSSSFRSLTIISFSNGSIINNMDLRFASASVPSNVQIGNVLIRAAPIVTDFNIETSSVTVEGSETSSGVSHNISLITAVSMVLLSWLLSSQQLVPC
ncbi:putative uncharacterized protein DDB_G0282133 [Cololabis saira]|uniref:putative uncharacterized protein DDB_G0282133 n=1 Tax=Cololabis saira TaxID=129043 RepID=UPI002AD49989|nr:putative uncharacterized protein DDB_G0282133 [Cololabis saira]